MKWRVGDKVRLVGEKWFMYPCPRGRGTVREITKVHGRDRVQFEGDTAPWDMTEGWEIELVERKEENMIDISDVNVGDRVKLTRGNGDEATFTVDLKVPSHGVIGSAVNRFLDKDWDTLEIVERAFKLVPGLYTNVKTRDRVMITEDGKTYYTRSTGSWIPATCGGHVDDAARGKGGWGRDITF